VEIVTAKKSKLRAGTQGRGSEHSLPEGEDEGDNEEFGLDDSEDIMAFP
jgi:hypothetical protein